MSSIRNTTTNTHANTNTCTITNTDATATATTTMIRAVLVGVPITSCHHLGAFGLLGSMRTQDVLTMRGGSVPAAPERQFLPGLTDWFFEALVQNALLDCNQLKTLRRTDGSSQQPGGWANSQLKQLMPWQLQNRAQHTGEPGANDDVLGTSLQHCLGREEAPQGVPTLFFICIRFVRCLLGSRQLSQGRRRRKSLLLHPAQLPMVVQEKAEAGTVSDTGWQQQLKAER